MKSLDSFSQEDSDRVYGIKENLKKNYPKIDWETQWTQQGDINGKPLKIISLIVPSSQYKEAVKIYEKFNGSEFASRGSSFDSLIKEVIKFRDERDWEKFHNPKDLALSLSLEASELLENFQWKTSEQAINDNMDDIVDEIADVVIYALLLSNRLDINLEKAVREKISKNELKYPVEKSFGTSKKYTEL